MTNPFNRGSSPGRARDSLQRSGSFKPGHKKRGGESHYGPNNRLRHPVKGTTIGDPGRSFRFILIAAMTAHSAEHR